MFNYQATTDAGKGSAGSLPLSGLRPSRIRPGDEPCFPPSDYPAPSPDGPRDPWLLDTIDCGVEGSLPWIRAQWPSIPLPTVGSSKRMHHEAPVLATRPMAESTSMPLAPDLVSIHVDSLVNDS